MHAHVVRGLPTKRIPYRVPDTNSHTVQKCTAQYRTIVYEYIILLDSVLEYGIPRTIPYTMPYTVPYIILYHFMFYSTPTGQETGTRTDGQTARPTDRLASFTQYPCVVYAGIPVVYTFVRVVYTFERVVYTSNLCCLRTSPCRLHI